MASRMTSAMQLAMFGAAEKLKVFRAVICLDSVDMVDRLIASQAAANHLLHHVTMFKDIAFVRSRIRVLRHSQKNIAKAGYVAAFAATHPVAVVSADVLADNPSTGKGHLPTTARAKLGLNWLPFVVAFEVARALLVAQIWAPGNALSAAASAKRRFQSVASQEVRRLVTEEVFGRNLLAAPTLAKHSPSVTRG